MFCRNPKLLNLLSLVSDHVRQLRMQNIKPKSYVLPSLNKFKVSKAALMFPKPVNRKKYLHNCQVIFLGFTKLRETGICRDNVSHKVTDVKLTCCTTRFQDLFHLIFQITQDSQCVIIGGLKNSTDNTFKLAIRPNSPIQVSKFQNQINSCFLLALNYTEHQLNTFPKRKIPTLTGWFNFFLSRTFTCKRCSVEFPRFQLMT